MEGGPIRSTPLRHLKNTEVMLIVGKRENRTQHIPGFIPRANKDGFVGDACRPNCSQSQGRRGPAAFEAIATKQKGALRIATQIATLAGNRILQKGGISTRPIREPP